MTTTRLIPIAPAAAGFSACLGVFFLGSALAQTPPAPAAATPDTLPRQITSKVLFVTDSKDPKKQSGAMDVILRISENTSGQPVVSCSIPTPGVRNDQWQAAAWMAAFVASRRLDLQVSDYEFNINATGVIDGPSAGMELAASLIALINNVPIKPGRIMTGSVNPDGTIGPVGGIAAKIEAASRLAATPAAGAEPAAFVGIPIGQRIEFREAENKYIDLIDFARQRKVTAVELRDVDDAYYFLTEQRLPSSGRSAPVTTPQVSLAAINRLRSAHLAMQEEVNAGTKALSAICERRAPGGTARDYDGHFLLGQLGLAGDYSRRATAASNGGALIAGYYQLLKAAACADIGKNYDRILGAPSGKAKGGDKDDRILSAVGHIIELRGEVAQSREKLASAIKESIGSRQLVLKLEALNAQISLREAYSYEVAADDMVLGTLVQMLKAEADAGGKGRVAAPDFYPMVQQACTYYALAKTRYTAAHNWYSFSLARDKGNDLEVRPGLPFFQNIGSAFSKGAQSALAYLDATMKQGWEAYLEGNEPPIKFEGSQVPFKIRGARNEGLPIRIAMAGNIPFNDENFPRIASLIEGRYLPARKAAFSEANADGSDGGEAAGLLAGPQATAVPDSPLARLLKEKWDFTTPPTGDLDAFGSGASAFLSLSSLVMKYYNYQGDDQRMTNSRSIGIYIDLARAKALARAGLLRERILARIKPERREQPGWEGPGAENDSLLPEAITVNLELADILRYGGPDDKVISLMTFWRANMLADIALSMITYSEKNAQ